MVDDFNRKDTSQIGNNWSELRNKKSDAFIKDGKLFLNSARTGARPMVQNKFLPQAKGKIRVSFDLDLALKGRDPHYGFFMQMGEAKSMRNDRLHDGVAVNLRWGKFGNRQESCSGDECLGYFTPEGKRVALKRLSGLSKILVELDLDSQRYSIVVNEVEIARDLSFARQVSAIDNVRFFNRNMNSRDFAGGSIDNVKVELVQAFNPKDYSVFTTFGSDSPVIKAMRNDFRVYISAYRIDRKGIDKAELDALTEYLRPLSKSKYFWCSYMGPVGSYHIQCRGQNLLVMCLQDYKAMSYGGHVYRTWCISPPGVGYSEFMAALPKYSPRADGRPGLQPILSADYIKGLTGSVDVGFATTASYTATLSVTPAPQTQSTKAPDRSYADYR